MKSLAIFGAVALVASSASAAFTGFSVERAITAEGNTQYKVYANWDQSNAVMLNAFNFTQISGSLNARHQDNGVDENEDPLGSWNPNLNGNSSARNNDSWITASGFSTVSANDTALDPSFSYPAGSTDRSFIPANAGWFDATPGAPNLVLAGGAQGGYRMLLVQIVRSGSGDDPIATFGMTVGWKLANTTTALFAGTGQVITIGVPAPGALALLGLAGLAARRRRG